MKIGKIRTFQGLEHKDQAFKDKGQGKNLKLVFKKSLWTRSRTRTNIPGNALCNFSVVQKWQSL